MAFGTQVLSTDDSEFYSLAHNNEPKSHLQSPDAKNHLLTFNKVLHTDALVAIFSSLRDLGTHRAVSLRILKRSYLLKRYHVKCLMPALFLPPESPVRVIKFPNFLTHFFLGGIQWAFRPGFIFYVLPRVNYPTKNLT